MSGKVTVPDQEFDWMRCISARFLIGSENGSHLSVTHAETTDVTPAIDIRLRLTNHVKVTLFFSTKNVKNIM